MTNLRDKGMATGRLATSPSACFLEDVLVEIGEGTAELCPKIISGHGIKLLKCAGMRGDLTKDRDTVNEEGEDLSNCLGGDLQHGLIVCCRYGGENSVQEGSYGQVL